MTDAEYIFMHDAKDKKSIAASAYRKRIDSRGCKLPFESIPYNKRSKLNGEVKTVANLDRPMKWNELKALPDDIKVKYIMRLRELYHADYPHIAVMLGVSCRYLSLIAKNLGIDCQDQDGKISRNRMTLQQKESWKAFCNGVIGGGDTSNNDPEKSDQFDAVVCDAPHVEEVHKAQNEAANKMVEKENQRLSSVSATMVITCQRLTFERDFYKERYFELLAILGERK